MPDQQDPKAQRLIDEVGEAIERDPLLEQEMEMTLHQCPLCGKVKYAGQRCCDGRSPWTP